MSANIPYAKPALATTTTDEKTAFDRLFAFVDADLDRVNAVIRTHMSSNATPLIPELAAHLIEAGGKRLRPMLTLAAARLCGHDGTNDYPVKLAAAVEFIHTATLLHDDVVDDSKNRRGRRSANLLWGNKPSILVGDFLFSRSFQLMVETHSIAVLKALSDASAIIAEGEVLQLSTTHTISGDDSVYMRVIRAKTAALFEAAMIGGGIVSGAADAQLQGLRRYGDALGISFQLIDDALDYGGASERLGKSIGDDFREGKPTLPAIFAFANGTSEDKAFWTRCIARRRQADGDLEHAIALIKSSGALEQTIAQAKSAADSARAALAVFAESPLRHALEDMADFVVSRAE